MHRTLCNSFFLYSTWACKFDPCLLIWISCPTILLMYATTIQFNIMTFSKISTCFFFHTFRVVKYFSLWIITFCQGWTGIAHDTSIISITIKFLNLLTFNSWSQILTWSICKNDLCWRTPITACIVVYFSWIDITFFTISIW